MEPGEDEIVPYMLEPDEEEGEELITMIDEIPFQDTRKKIELNISRLNYTLNSTITSCSLVYIHFLLY